MGAVCGVGGIWELDAALQHRGLAADRGADGGAHGALRQGLHGDGDRGLLRDEDVEDDVLVRGKLPGDAVGDCGCVAGGADVVGGIRLRG